MKILYTLFAIACLLTITSAQNSIIENKLLQKKFELNSTFLSAKDSAKNNSNKHYLKTASLVPQYDSIYYWVWDTATNVWNINRKDINFSYDINNNRIEYINQNWNGVSWLNYHKYITIYDANNNLILVSNQAWDTSGWVNCWTQQNYTYDLNNNRINDTAKSWNGSAWIAGGNSSNTYDANNNLTTTLQQYWSGSAFVNTNLFTNIYDANNNKTNDLMQKWRSGSWQNYNQGVYTYDVNNNQTSVLRQSWDTTTSSWQTYQNYTSTYDTNSYLTSRLFPYQSYGTFIYDTSYNLINRVSQLWNGSTYVNYYSIIDTYDLNHNNIHEYRNKWISGAWVFDSTYYQTYDFYDVNNNMTHELFQWYNGSIWANAQNTNDTYDSNSFKTSHENKYLNEDYFTFIAGGDSIYYYFSNSTVNVMGQTKTDNIQIYPNPATDEFTVSSTYGNIKEIKIIDLLGKEIRTINFTGRQLVINKAEMKAGIYFVQTTDEKKHICNRKIIIQ